MRSPESSDFFTRYGCGGVCVCKKATTKPEAAASSLHALCTALRDPRQPPWLPPFLFLWLNINMLVTSHNRILRPSHNITHLDKTLDCSWSWPLCLLLAYLSRASPAAPRCESTTEQMTFRARFSGSAPLQTPRLIWIIFFGACLDTPPPFQIVYYTVLSAKLRVGEGGPQK